MQSSAEGPGPIPTSSGTNADESPLVSGRSVQGMAVYSPTGEELGTIDDVMIEPVSGRVAYGVLQFGGVLGLGADYHPIPFSRLSYDPARGGYVPDSVLAPQLRPGARRLRHRSFARAAGRRAAPRRHLVPRPRLAGEIAPPLRRRSLLALIPRAYRARSAA